MDKKLISLAPLQGITDYSFRNAFSQYFAGVAFFYTPYLRLLKDASLKNVKQRDILPENNSSLRLIPQIMTNQAEEFLFFDSYLNDLGYKELNWNLGCPYPMVTNRKLGAGLLEHPDLLKEILEKVSPKLKCKLSLKMRLGNQNENEIYKIVPILNDFPLSEIILHPRIGKQLYKGDANPDAFEKLLTALQHKLAYNGDIDSPTTFKKLQDRFPQVNHFMIGRKLISNPFLASDLLLISSPDLNRTMYFQEFHEHLFEIYAEKLSGQAHLLKKMTNLWEYFSQSFSNSHKVYKLIKKAKSLRKYDEAINRIFRNEIFQSNY